LVIPAAEAAATNTTAADANFAPLADTVYIVQPGDTLSGIAWAFYGNGNLWPSIFNANAGQIANPHWIYPNQRFVIPSATYGTFTTGTTSYIDWKLNLTPNVKANSQYTVVWGDTLSQLAYVAYGDGNAWWRIYQANTDKIANPDLIYPGQVFKIP
jgi:nucleoid-associated protein YgaU